MGISLIRFEPKEIPISGCSESIPWWAQEPFKLRKFLAKALQAIKPSRLILILRALSPQQPAFNLQKSLFIELNARLHKADEELSLQGFMGKYESDLWVGLRPLIPTQWAVILSIEIQGLIMIPVISMEETHRTEFYRLKPLEIHFLGSPSSV